jgi:hypothetical protein
LVRHSGGKFKGLFSQQSIKNDSDIIKWLHHFSGLAFLCLEEVRDSFEEAFISDVPNGK